MSYFHVSQSLTSASVECLDEEFDELPLQFVADPNFEGPLTDEQIDELLLARFGFVLSGSESESLIVIRHQIPALPPEGASSAPDAALAVARSDSTSPAATAVAEPAVPPTQPPRQSLGFAHRLAAAPSAMVLVVLSLDEGRMADELFPHAITVVCDPAMGINGYDWQALVGRAVRFWFPIASSDLTLAVQCARAAGVVNVLVLNEVKLEEIAGRPMEAGWRMTQASLEEGLHEWVEEHGEYPDSDLWAQLGACSLPAGNGTAVAPAPAMIEEAWEPEEASFDVPTAPVLDPKDFSGAAKIFWQKAFNVHGQSRLRIFGGIPYVWTGTRWRAKDISYLHSWLWAFGTHALVERKGHHDTPKYDPYHPNRYKVENLYAALAASQRVDLDQVPGWLDAKTNKSRPRSESLIAFVNGLMDVDHPEQPLLPHTPLWFSETCLPYAYEPTAVCPKFLAFLDEVFKDDPESILSLQMWFGYSLVFDTTQQKMLLLLGPPRAGKGLLLRILVAMLGVHNVAAPSLTSLAGNFGMAPLVGKLIAVISDAHVPGHLKVLALDRLKNISGEDFVNIDRKNLPAIDTKLSCRFVMAANELIDFPDPSGALVSRFIMLKFRQSFVGKENRGLEAELMTELPGILNWALEGLRKFREAGELLQPKSGLESITDFRYLTSPVKRFVDECCINPAPGKTISCEQLRRVHTSYAHDAHEREMAAAVFGEALRSAATNVSRCTQGGRNEKRTYIYTNITLSEYGQEIWRRLQSHEMSPRQARALDVAEREASEAQSDAQQARLQADAYKKLLKQVQAYADRHGLMDLEEQVRGTMFDISGKALPRERTPAPTPPAPASAPATPTPTPPPAPTVPQQPKPVLTPAQVDAHIAADDEMMRALNAQMERGGGPTGAAS